MAAALLATGTVEAAKSPAASPPRAPSEWPAPPGIAKHGRVSLAPSRELAPGLEGLEINLVPRAHCWWGHRCPTLPFVYLLPCKAFRVRETTVQVQAPPLLSSDSGPFISLA